MALSTSKRETAQELPEGEPVLTFHGWTMCPGHCISVSIEDKEAKYLVHYQTQKPESVASSSKAKHSTSRAGPSTSTSRAGPSISRAGPSTSQGGRSPRSNPLGGAMFTGLLMGEATAMGSYPREQGRVKPPKRIPREPGPLGVSCRHDAGDPQQNSTTGRLEVQVNLSMSLRPLLMLDWDKKKLCNLPAKVSADAILFEYATFPLKGPTRDQSYAVWGLVAVVKECFNLYGGVQLLHLFQQLGSMLTCTALDDSSMNVLLSHLQDFLDFLADNPSLLFNDASDYEPASEEHLKVAT
ncbi:mortality factor 4-like protein 1 [Notamacropus eugenii]|uniref:mortality factor 4-like protein 1 n=1 Tax=Notamacropus eugenii TaxID=9315 RepID=UPI003B67B6AE